MTVPLAVRRRSSASDRPCATPRLARASAADHAVLGRTATAGCRARRSCARARLPRRPPRARAGRRAAARRAVDRARPAGLRRIDAADRRRTRHRRLRGAGCAAFVDAARAAGRRRRARPLVRLDRRRATPLADGLPGRRRVVLVNPIAAPALDGPRGARSPASPSLYYWLGARAARARSASRCCATGVDRAGHEHRRWRRRRIRRCAAGSTTSTTATSPASATAQVVLEAFAPRVTHDVSEYAARIGRCPCSWSRRSTTTSRRSPAQQALQTLFPDARLVVIPDVGHLVHYETPAASAADADPRLRGPSEPWRPRRSRRSSSTAATSARRPARRHQPLHRRHRRRRSAGCVPLTMLINDERQLELLPDLPWALASGARPAPREPLVAAQCQQAASPTWCSRPMQTMGRSAAATGSC